MEFDLEHPLTNSHGLHFDPVPSLFLIESDHMPSQNYLKTLKATDFDISVRREAISSILQVSSIFDPILSYLAINYLDRFLSSQGIPEPKPWVIRLLAVSCVSLAAKTKKTEFSLTDIQGDGGFIFDTQTMQPMEELILGALKWRMRSITPFSFFSYFISLFKLKDPPLRQDLKAKAIEIILKSQTEINVLEFKPSIVAASALLSASHALFPLQFSCFRNALSICSYVNKVLAYIRCYMVILLEEKMLQCYNLVQDIAMEEYESVFDTVLSLDAPVNVLDQHFSSRESVKTGETTSSSSKRRPQRDVTRRKISSYCKNRRVQLSGIQHCSLD